MDEKKIDLQMRVSQRAYDRLLEFAPSPRKRGEWLSELLEAYEPEKTEEGVLERLERKIDRLIVLMEGN